MKVDPVKTYREPRFPTRAILDAHPELLRLLPKRWQRNAVVLTAVAAVCALALGLRRGNAPGVHIAPLFTHGEGFYIGVPRGATTPPDFLSEDEARFIIRDEAAKAGLSFEPTKDTLPSVSLPRVQPVAGIPSPVPTKKGLALDGKERTRPIWYEYVSINDNDDWYMPPIFEVDPEPAPTYPLRATAKALQGNMQGIKRKGAYGIFYDPMAEVRSSEYPIAIIKGIVYAPKMVLADELPSIDIESYFPQTRKEYEEWEAARETLYDLPEMWRLRSRYGSDIIPLESFCAEKKLTYVWDAGDRTATVTDLATRKTVVFSSGGPAASKTALREQVRDFLAWLKAEGVI